MQRCKSTKSVISNDKMEYIIENIGKTIENERKRKEARFLHFLMGASGVTLLANKKTGKSGTRGGEKTIRAGHGTVTESKNFQFCFILNYS